MTWETVQALAGHGYSDREAAFLYIVALHSGYFLRRQFNQFVHRERGAIATHFLEKAKKLGQVVDLGCADGRKLYHLRSRQIYRGVGAEGSQGRRVKSPTEIRRRLITLDYVISHLESDRFAESDASKRALFMERFRSSNGPDEFPPVWNFILVSVPVEQPAMVRFVYVDPGHRSTSNLVRFLRTHLKLMRSLRSVEVVYVATEPALFHDARRAFDRLMPLRYVFHAACPRGVEHLIRWLESRARFLEGREPISPAEDRFLSEGNLLYRAAVHRGLIASFENQAINADKVRSIFGDSEHRVVFRTELLEESYPRFLDSGSGYCAGYPGNQRSLFDRDLPNKDQKPISG